VGIAYARNSDAAFVNETFLAHLKRMSGAAPSRVAMCVGARIPVKPGAHSARLRDRAHGEVAKLVAEARRLVDGTG
jgi:hypothetical protein